MRSRFSSKVKMVSGFGLGVAVAAALTFGALSSATAQSNMGKGFKKYGCGDVCQSRLYLCLSRGGDPMPCYYSYSACSSGCNGGFRQPAPTE